MSQSEYTFSWLLTDGEIDAYHAMLRRTYWASHRTRDEVRRSLECSLIIAARHPDDGLVGSARAVTDKVTHTWICDVVVHEDHQRKGLGRQMLERLLSHPDIRATKKLLATKDAQEFYRKLGFETHPFECLSKGPSVLDQQI